MIKFDIYHINLSKLINLVNQYFLLIIFLVWICDQQCIVRSDLQRSAAFKVVIIQRHLKVMLITPSVNIEILLVDRICHAILNFLANHDLLAFHKVHHDVFQLRFASFIIDYVKINFVIRAHLKTVVALNIVQEALQRQRSVERPSLHLFKVVVNTAEENYLLRNLRNDCFVVHKVHVT